ncbi:CehA/McbA family metallohydrolase, partial [candidate division KSB1 bacterium]|nr:CehA/McbA family metallohydrolase [candidate division KSB1 bacterium]
KNLTIKIFYQHKIISTHAFSIYKTVSQKFWFQIFEIELKSRPIGDVLIDATIEIEINGRVKQYSNDNYRISSHKPFSVYLAEQSLPDLNRVVWGDLHYHSNYTADQVEFGAPLAATVQLGKALGLKFFAVTDHSYDLDDDENNMLKNDPELKKWQNLLSEVESLNTNHDFLIIPGEEVSAGNHRDKNVHFLILNNKKFIPGKGDGAEKWFQTKPDLSIAEILQKLESSALAFASHPEIKPPFLQKLLVRRGKWEANDYEHGRLNGLQIWNGKNDVFFLEGLSQWRKQLLDGRKLIIVAGNDAHGNFNRFRQIGFPFFTFREKNFEIFGSTRTGVILSRPKLSLSSLLDCLRQGRCVISNGPLLLFYGLEGTLNQFQIGDTFHAGGIDLHIQAQSTNEFGNLKNLIIYVGDILKHDEYMLWEERDFSFKFQYEKKINIPSLPQKGYIRGELHTEGVNQDYHCYTNPLWIELEA